MTCSIASRKIRNNSEIRKKLKMKLSIFIAFCSIILSNISCYVEALDPYKFLEEGPCSRIRSNPEPQPSLNREFLDSLRYIQEGNRYHIYRLASHTSKYDKLYDDDLSREFCLERNISTHADSSVGSVSGFGNVIYSFQVRVPKDPSGLYFEARARDGSPSWDVARHYITLTDNRNFAVEFVCWTGSNQVGWMLLSRSPYVDETFRRLAMDHAITMGFDSRNFISLHHDKCGPEDQRNSLRYQAGDNYDFLRGRNSPYPDTRIGVGVPYRNEYLSMSYQAAPGQWFSRPTYYNYNNNYGSWQQMRYRQQY